MAEEMTRRDVLKLAAAGAAAVSGGLPDPAGAQTTPKRELVVAQGGDIAFFDPHMSTSSNDIRISFNLYDNLTSRRPDGKLAPGLATEWKLQGQTTWAFKLRPGVKWHNGDPFSSADVKFSIDRSLDKTLKGNRVSTVLTTVDRVETPDPGTVLIHTKETRSAAPGSARVLRGTDDSEAVCGIRRTRSVQPGAGGHRPRALRLVDEGRPDRARGEPGLLGRPSGFRSARGSGPTRDGPPGGRAPQG